MRLGLISAFALALTCTGVVIAATPYNGFAPVATKEKCFVVLPVQGMSLTEETGWDQPCAPGSVAEGAGTLSMRITGDLFAESTGTLTGGYLHGAWTVSSSMLKSDGSRRRLGKTDIRLNMGCTIGHDGAQTNADCVPGTPLPKPADAITVTDTESFAYVIWRNQKSAGRPGAAAIKDYAIPAYEAPFCLELGAADEAPRGQPGGRLLINACAVKVAAAWCVRGAEKGCETGDGHIMLLPARTGVVLPADETGEVIHFACSGTSIRPIVTESGADGFYCD